MKRKPSSKTNELPMGKRIKHPLDLESQKPSAAANFNVDVLGVIFDYLDYKCLLSKLRFVSLQWNEAFCNMPVVSSRIKAPLSDLFESKARGGELCWLRNLSLAGFKRDFDFSLLPNIEKLKLRSYLRTSCMAPISIQSLSNLKSLMLYGFNTTKKIVNSWSKLTKLEEITVEYNEFCFHTDLYSNLGVKKLSLSFMENDTLYDLTPILNGNLANTLTHLNIVSPFSTISFIHSLPRLTHLELKCCEMKKVDLQKLPLLSHINFDNTLCSDKIFNHPSLVRVILRSIYNGVGVIERFGDGLEELEMRKIYNVRMSSVQLCKNLRGLKSLAMPCLFIGNPKDFSLPASLTSLNVNNTRLGSQPLKSISKLTQLTSLNIGSNDICTDVFKYLTKLVRLTSLDVEDCRIKNIEPITKYTKLTELNLRNNYLKGEWLKKLTLLPDLQILNLKGNEMKDLSPISEMKNLNTLRLKSLKFSDIHETELIHLLKLEKLKVLSLNSMDIGEEGAKILSSVKFKYLNLKVCELTDKSIPYIIKITSLRHLQLQNNNITDKGVNLISKANLPFLRKLKIATDQKGFPTQTMFISF